MADMAPPKTQPISPTPDTKDINTSESTPKKLRQNPSNREARSNIKAKTVHTLTLANPSYTYIHLCLINHDHNHNHNQFPHQPRSQPSPPPPTSNSKAAAQTTTTNPIDTTNTTIDNLTVLKYLHSALRQYLGLHGIAIPIDILKVEEEEEEEGEKDKKEEEKEAGKRRRTRRRKGNIEVWIRVPREDGSKVLAAVGGWVGRGEGPERGVGAAAAAAEGGGGADASVGGITGVNKMVGSTTTTMVSWRIKSWGNWLAEIASGDGADLFR